MTEPFFVLEGGEGSGKSTQLQLLLKRLPLLFPDREIVFTREPGGSPFAESIRSLILSDDARDLDGEGAFYAFALARHDHIQNCIRPALDAGKIVICDRFAAATYAYQACAMENPITEDAFSHYFNNLKAKPALTIVLDIDPTIGAERLKGRFGGDYNHFDRRPIEFHQRVREGYLNFDRFSPTLVLNASESIEEVYEKVVSGIRSHI